MWQRPRCSSWHPIHPFRIMQGCCEYTKAFALSAPPLFVELSKTTTVRPHSEYTNQMEKVNALSGNLHYVLRAVWGKASTAYLFSLKRRRIWSNFIKILKEELTYTRLISHLYYTCGWLRQAPRCSLRHHIDPFNTLQGCWECSQVMVLHGPHTYPTVLCFHRAATPRRDWGATKSTNT